MKTELRNLIFKAVNELATTGILGEVDESAIVIDRTRDPSHGDFACNIAMRLAKKAGKNPRDLAGMIIAGFPQNSIVEKTEIAGPGFINLFINKGTATAIVKKIIAEGSEFGKGSAGNGKKVLIEFVSANPTGPLHVGHGRGAAYGAAVADLLANAGFAVDREYYVNDAGRQMDILAASVWLRYLEQAGKEFAFPSNGYKGKYIYDIAGIARDKHGEDFMAETDAVFAGVTADEPAGGDKEKHIDDLIARAKEILGSEGYRTVFDIALEFVLEDIKDDLQGFGIDYQNWFSERSLMENGEVAGSVERLQGEGFIYEKEGALWFKSSEMGDEKDRPVRRSNGDFTYFASDIAYHKNKYERGYDEIINVWGADHHGYIARVNAAIEAIKQNPEQLKVLLVQFAILYRGGEKAQMSTRSGEFVTIRQLREEVGRDAARFFYVMRKAEQHLDFDLDLAKSESSDNPVYYIQYAHARICSVLRQLAEKQIEHDLENGYANLNKLEEPQEAELFRLIAKYPEVVEHAALKYEPHNLCHYLKDLANGLHTYYNAHQFIVEDKDMRDARLTLVLAVKQVLANGLRLLGVSAPEEM